MENVGHLVLKYIAGVTVLIEKVNETRMSLKIILGADFIVRDFVSTESDSIAVAIKRNCTSFITVI